MTTIGPLVATGRTSDVYEFGHGSVVKVSRPDVPRHWAALEARFTAEVRDLGAPAPEVRDMVQVEGRDAVVFERVRAPSMWDLMVASPKDVPALAMELAQIHKRIMATGLPVGIAGLVERVSAKIADVDRLSDAEKSESKRDLARLPSGAALLHGDLHPGNVLMSDRGPVVIDWFDASIGHPVADVVRSSILVRPFEATGERPHLPGGARDLLAALHEGYVSAIRGEVSASPEELCLWEGVVAAGRLAEGAESDESALLKLWRMRHRPKQSQLATALSGSTSRD